MQQKSANIMWRIYNAEQTTHLLSLAHGNFKFLNVYAVNYPGYNFDVLFSYLVK